MEKVKNVVRSATGSDSQFQSGHNVPVQHQEYPGSQEKMEPKPAIDELPTEDGGYQKYKAAGKLKGKKAIITGGDSGIGRSIAVLFAMEGADSLIVYLPQEEKDAQETKSLVEQYGAKCHLLPTDVRSKENCQTIVDTAMSEMGAINILVNNAAYQKMVKDIFDLSDEQWVHTFNTNIHPYFYLSKAALKHMKRGDTIINSSSVNPYIGRDDLLDYTSTKGAIVAFTRGLSNQMVSKGIRVNAVCPGPIWTPLIPSTMTDDAIESFTSPMGRPGQPSEVATCYVFLASPDSSFMSGQCLHPNGGTIVSG